MNRRLVTLAASFAGIVIAGVCGSTSAIASGASPVDSDAAVVAFTGWAAGESLTLDRIACFVDDTGVATCYGLADGLPVAYEAASSGEGDMGGVYRVGDGSEFRRTRAGPHAQRRLYGSAAGAGHDPGRRRLLLA